MKTKTSKLASPNSNAYFRIETVLDEDASECRSSREVQVVTLLTLVTSPHASPKFRGRLDVMNAIEGGNVAWAPVSDAVVL